MFVASLWSENEMHFKSSMILIVSFSGILNKEFFEGLSEGLGKKSTQSWYTYGGSSVDHVRNEPALCFYLELPQAGWWNGKEWVDYKTHFEVPLEYFGENKDDNKYYEHLYGVSKQAGFQRIQYNHLWSQHETRHHVP